MQDTRFFVAPNLNVCPLTHPDGFTHVIPLHRYRRLTGLRIRVRRNGLPLIYLKLVCFGHRTIAGRERKSWLPCHLSPVTL